jgi:predicted aconitase with swiveling domain
MAERAWSATVRPLLAGRASGAALVLDEPLSMWGGLDAASGRIIDLHHAQAGADVSGRVLVMPAGRGSSSSASVLAEAVNLGHGPAGIVLAAVDEILLLGALALKLLDGPICPIVVARAADYRRLTTGDRAVLDGDRLTVTTRR